MPTLAEAKVKYLALELPVQMNGFLKNLYHEVRTKHLNENQIYEALNKAIEASGKDIDFTKLPKFTKDEWEKIAKKLDNQIEVTGGENRAKDWAKLIKSSAENGIKVIGIDPRSTTEFAGLHLTAALNEDPKNETKNARDAMKLQRSLDAEAASNLKKLTHGERVAVMYSAAHGCTGLDGPSIVQELTKAQVSVANFTTLPKSELHTPIPQGVCPVPPSTAIDAPKVLRDMAHHPKPAGIGAP